MLKEYRLTAECFLLPVPPPASFEIAYFPLQALALKVNKNASAILRTLIEREVVDSPSAIPFLQQLIEIGVVNGCGDKEPGIDQPGKPLPARLMLLISERCNLLCEYCYSKATSSAPIMSREIARHAIELAVANAETIPNRCVDLTFHGGGEPTMNWSVLVDTVSYGKTLCEERNLGFKTTICTNGIVSKKKAEWLADNIDTVVVSIDGAPDIQDVQRPLAAGGSSFALTSRTLDVLSKKGKSYILRMTATERSEQHIAEQYAFLAKRFKPRSICIEPLFVCGRCATNACQPPQKELFVSGFLSSMLKSPELGVSAQYSGGRIYYLDSIFCGAAGHNFIVTSAGLVTSCLEVTSRDDPRSESFVYGSYDAGRGEFVFDLNRFRSLGQLRVQGMDWCRDCFAKWHCAGDCPAKVSQPGNVNSGKNSYRCEVNRQITLSQLYAEMGLLTDVNGSFTDKEGDHEKDRS
jgi:uncharacterized protein